MKIQIDFFPDSDSKKSENHGQQKFVVRYPSPFFSLRGLSLCDVFGGDGEHVFPICFNFVGSGELKKPCSAFECDFFFYLDSKSTGTTMSLVCMYLSKLIKTITDTDFQFVFIQHLNFEIQILLERGY